MKLGDSVQIRCLRPHREQYNGLVGQISVITNKDIVYVTLGDRCPCFYPDEIELVPVPTEAVAR